jgi:hypothetical protein
MVFVSRGVSVAEALVGFFRQGLGIGTRSMRQERPGGSVTRQRSELAERHIPVSARTDAACLLAIGGGGM